MQTRSSTASPLPVELKTNLRNLIEDGDTYVDDIKSIIVQYFAIDNVIRFLDEASKSESMDTTLQNKYLQVLESLRSQMPAERSEFVSNMNINHSHIQNMVVNGYQTVPAPGVHAPSMADCREEKLGNDRSRYKTEYDDGHGAYQEPSQPLPDGSNGLSRSKRMRVPKIQKVPHP